MLEKYNVDIIQEYILDDKYNRLNEIGEIDKLIGSYPYIKLGVNGDWGSGKSVVARMIYYAANNSFNQAATDICSKFFPNMMNGNSNIIYFDASKEDIFDNPLLSLAKVISVELEKKYQLNTKTCVEQLIDIFSFIPIVSKINNIINQTQKLVNAKSYLDDLYNTEKIIEIITQLFENGKKYVLLIDELDRCEPKYVLELLSTIKHFFGLDNLAIIYFYNYKELWQLIKKEYGYENEQYLQKFIDYEIKIKRNNFYINYSEESLSSADFKVKMCSIIYDLNPREINNLKFIMKIEDFYKKVDIFHALAISHLCIKKMEPKTFTYDYFLSIRSMLREIVSSNELNTFYDKIRVKFEIPDAKYYLDEMIDKYVA